jgi:uncharacterized membrane protein
MDLKTAVEQEELHLRQLSKLVEDSVNEEKLISGRLLELEADVDTSFGMRLADKVAELGGSWLFIVGFFIAMLGWIGLNTWQAVVQHFDPYPYILLNLVLSCLAAIQAPVIMMSQNRREEKDRRRARSDFMINLKAEMEVRNLHSKMDLLISEQMQSLFKIQQAQLDLLVRIEAARQEK